jgi:hypothetical protein
MNKTAPNWSDLKGKLAELDRAGLIGLIQDLYAAGKKNKAFLHARFGLGEDVLAPYKAIISRWINPDVIKNQGFSISTAKKAIADYRRAVGKPEGMAELATYYCEECTALLSYCGMDDEGYFAALVRMFQQAVQATAALEREEQNGFIERLDRVREAGHKYGYWVGDTMDELFLEIELDEDS